MTFLRGSRERFRIFISLLPLVFFLACARDAKQVVPAASGPAAQLELNKSTGEDVLALFGQPHIKTRMTHARPLPDFIDPKKYLPYESWTYIRSDTDKNLERDVILVLLGVAKLSRDINTWVIDFNEEGKVIGYVLADHRFNREAIYPAEMNRLLQQAEKSVQEARTTYATAENAANQAAANAAVKLNALSETADEKINQLLVEIEKTRQDLASNFRAAKAAE